MCTLSVLCTSAYALEQINVQFSASGLGSRCFCFPPWFLIRRDEVSSRVSVCAKLADFSPAAVAQRFVTGILILHLTG